DVHLHLPLPAARAVRDDRRRDRALGLRRHPAYRVDVADRCGQGEADLPHERGEIFASGAAPVVTVGEGAEWTERPAALVDRQLVGMFSARLMGARDALEFDEL